jgi:hypothetical protein
MTEVILDEFRRTSNASPERGGTDEKPLAVGGIVLETSISQKKKKGDRMQDLGWHELDLESSSGSS